MHHDAAITGGLVRVGNKRFVPIVLSSSVGVDAPFQFAHGFPELSSRASPHGLIGDNLERWEDGCSWLAFGHWDGRMHGVRATQPVRFELLAFEVV